MNNWSAPSVCEPLCTFKLSSVGLKLPAADRPEPVDKLIQEVADGITAMTMAALPRTKGP